MKEKKNISSLITGALRLGQNLISILSFFMNWQILDPHHVKAIECISLYKKLFSSEDIVVQIDMSKKSK